VRAEAIFGPVSVLALWTGAVLLGTGLRRVSAVQRGRVPQGAFRYGESPEVPDNLRVWNRNLMNLLEMPILFYVVCIAFYVTRRVTPDVLVLGWVYVALRLLHSFVHLTSNRVIVRLGLFAVGNFVLISMWIRFAIRVL
jgi:hypothetical protein